MKTLRLLSTLTIALLAMCASLQAQYCDTLPCKCGDEGTWIKKSFSYVSHGVVIFGPVSSPLLLTDGRVMVQFLGITHQGEDWYALTPDSTGSYVNGSWSALASLTSVPGGYAPYNYASDVLANGKVIIEGGEKNFDGSAYSNLGAVYDPVANTWTGLAAPDNWPAISDAQSVILPDGTYMVAACGGVSQNCTDYHEQQALLDPNTLTWTSVLTNDGKSDPNSEEGYTLLPNGKVLTINTHLSAPYPTNPTYELFDPTANPPGWTSADLCVKQNGVCQHYIDLTGKAPNAAETGPAIGLPDGTVLATGASVDGVSGGARPATTAIYNPPPIDTWTQGPTFGQVSGHYVGMGDESAALLSGGDVLLAVHESPRSGSYYFERYHMADQSLCSVTTTPSDLVGGSVSSARMLLLPTGEVFVTMTQNDSPNPLPYYYFYEPPTQTPDSSWAPFIDTTSLRGTYLQGSIDNSISGYRFNGLSQANQLGDEFQNATNYPLVRITNNTTHKVVYARTHDHSTMGLQTAGDTDTTSTKFDVPSTADPGPSTLVVVTNGISSSNSATVTICSPSRCSAQMK